MGLNRCGDGGVDRVLHWALASGVEMEVVWNCGGSTGELYCLFTTYGRVLNRE